MVVLVFTFISIGIIAVITWRIYQLPVDKLKETYNLEMTEDDREYLLLDVGAIPMFSAAMMTLFEGNQQILNIYSEAQDPQDFFPTLVILFLLMLIFIAFLVGVLGYLAFGNTC